MTAQNPNGIGATSRADVTTPKAAHYLQQLCAHFRHKCPVTFDEQAGAITFSVGICRIRADTEILTLALAAPDDDRLALLQKAVESHLLRFAFREEMQLDWRRT